MLNLDSEVQKLEKKVVVSTLPRIVLTEILSADQYLAIPEANRLVNLSEEHLLRIYVMRTNGMVAKEIGEKLGYPREVIEKILSSLEYKAMVSMVSKDIVESARHNLESAVGHAVSTLIGLLDSHDERIQIRASQDILNRVGLDSVKKIEVNTKTEHIHNISNDQLDYILKAAKVATELAARIPVEDTTYEEVSEDEQSE
jgi:patatin-like phospholipase/acyl hydrolase